MNGLIERILENWLDNSIETTFQKPFCYMLAAEGYEIIHMTRHCGYELGKDIIARDPNGNLCAYQLKSAKKGKISLEQWRNEISGQTLDLVMCQCVHPSIKLNCIHKSYLVTNGELEEEVIRAIDDRNRQWKLQGNQNNHLHTIVRGELLAMAKKLGVSLWPTELNDTKSFLEIMLADGKDRFPKDKLANIFENMFCLDDPIKERGAKAEGYRLIASAAQLCSFAVLQFSNANNYLSEIEAWVIFIAYTAAMLYRLKLSEKKVLKEINIARQAIINSLENLLEELDKREHLIEGDAITDQPVYRFRITWIAGLLPALYFWKSIDQQDNANIELINKILTKVEKKILLWGEAALPCFLAYYWYKRRTSGTIGPDIFIDNLINTLGNLQLSNSKKAIPSAYYSDLDVINNYCGVEASFGEDNFSGRSTYLFPMYQIIVRRNLKQHAKMLWPLMTKISNTCFILENDYDFFRYKNNNGENRFEFLPITMNWEELKSQCWDSDYSNIPDIMKDYPALLLIFLFVFPFRVSQEIVRFLDDKLTGFQK